MKEKLPLARVQDSVLEFLRHRDDAALFGAQAVNAYVDESRMTQDVDILSTRAAELAEEVRAHLSKEFTIAVRIREVADGKGFRIYQVRQPKNRYLVHVRQVGILPPNQIVADVRVPVPEELIARKVAVYSTRREQPRGGTDRRDLKLMLLTFPHLKSESGAVMSRLVAANADSRVLDEWRRFVASEITAGDSEGADEY